MTHASASQAAIRLILICGPVVLGVLALLTWAAKVAIKRLVARDPIPPFDFGERYGDFDGDEE